MDSWHLSDTAWWHAPAHEQLNQNAPCATVCSESKLTELLRQWAGEEKEDDEVDEGCWSAGKLPDNIDVDDKTLQVRAVKQVLVARQHMWN